MWSRDERVERWLAVERGLSLGLCGVGGRLEQAPADLPAAVRAVDAAYDERTARRLERFAAEPVGTQVWTRDEAGFLHRGSIVGPWRYDLDPEAWRADLVHVRPCAWLPPLEPQHAPAAVRASFARGGRNAQRIRLVD